tara:strand:- start:462 stop:689 length:228 start_codon:yes stop_codon:yes gene_type:complete
MFLKLIKLILSIIFAPFRLFVLILIWILDLPPISWFLKKIGLDDTIRITRFKEVPPLSKEFQEHLDKVNQERKYP